MQGKRASKLLQCASPRRNYHRVRLNHRHKDGSRTCLPASGGTGGGQIRLNDQASDKSLHTRRGRWKPAWPGCATSGPGHVIGSSMVQQNRGPHRVGEQMLPTMTFHAAWTPSRYSETPTREYAGTPIPNQRQSGTPGDQNKCGCCGKSPDYATVQLEPRPPPPGQQREPNLSTTPCWQPEKCIQQKGTRATKHSGEWKTQVWPEPSRRSATPWTSTALGTHMLEQDSEPGRQQPSAGLRRIHCPPARPGREQSPWLCGSTRASCLEKSHHGDAAVTGWPTRLRYIPDAPMPSLPPAGATTENHARQKRHAQGKGIPGILQTAAAKRIQSYRDPTKAATRRDRSLSETWPPDHVTFIQDVRECTATEP